MKNDKLPMWQDPDESPAVRRLIRAGRVAQADYDVESGLARYLANLQAGVPAPILATEAAHKATLTSLLGWLLPPIVSVIALGGWTLMHSDQASVPVLRPSAGITPTHATEPLSAGLPNATHAASEPAKPASDADAFARAMRLDEGSSAHTARSERNERNARAERAEPSDRSDDRLHLRREESSTRGYGKGAWNGGGVGAVRQGATSARRSSSGLEHTGRPGVAAMDPSATRPRAEDEAALAAPTDDVARAQPSAPTPSDPKASAESTSGQRPQPAAVLDSDSRLEREMQMLAVAQRVLASDPARALRLTRQGEHEFPGTMFSAERRQLGLLALVQLGRVAEARQKGAAFVRAYPNAPWTARLREALSTGRVPAL